MWTQDSPGLDGVVEVRDEFGQALTIGNFNGDAWADLAVGVPNEDVGGDLDAGAVQVLYGTATGLTAAGSQLWTQDSPGMEDDADFGDWFGVALAAGDFNGDARTDLAVGVPYEKVGDVFYAGAVQAVYGGAGGLSTTGNQWWHEDSPGVPGVARDDLFGTVVAAG